MVSIAPVKSSSLLRSLSGLAAASIALTSLSAEVQTITDQFGRSVTADVLSVENGKVKIKRDDGQIFELPLSSLTEETQRALTAGSVKAPSAIPAGTITLDLSRGVFDSSKNEEVAIVTTVEKWGYSVTVTNHSNKPVNNLKFRYVLFVKPDLEPGKDRSASTFKRSTGSTTVAELAGGTKTVFRTDSIKISKQKLKPGWSWTKTGNSEMIRDTLYGIWLKAYIGDQLVAEIRNPESLSKTEKGP